MKMVDENFILTCAYLIHTDTGNSYIIENSQFFLAAQGLENGQGIWRKYKKMEHMRMNRQLLHHIIDCYDRQGQLLATRKKRSKQLMLTNFGAFVQHRNKSHVLVG